MERYLTSLPAVFLKSVSSAMLAFALIIVSFGVLCESHDEANEEMKARISRLDYPHQVGEAFVQMINAWKDSRGR